MTLSLQSSKPVSVFSPTDSIYFPELHQMKKWLIILVISAAVLGCDKKHFELIPGVGIGNGTLKCYLGMSRSQIDESFKKNFNENLLFDNNGNLMLIAGITDSDCTIRGYSVRVGSLLDGRLRNQVKLLDVKDGKFDYGKFRPMGAGDGVSFLVDDMSIIKSVNIAPSKNWKKRDD